MAYWIGVLAERLQEQLKGQDWVDAGDAVLPELERLTDHELLALLDAVQTDGLRRGWGSYWWE